MAPIALIPNETWKYQLVDDRKDGPAGTWWTLRAPPAWLERQIIDAAEFERKPDGTELVHRNSGTILVMILEYCVVAVEHWKTADGKDVVLRKKKVGDHEVTDASFLDYLSIAHQVEISNAASNRTKVSVADSD